MTRLARMAFGLAALVAVTSLAPPTVVVAQDNKVNDSINVKTYIQQPLAAPNVTMPIDAGFVQDMLNTGATTLTVTATTRAVHNIGAIKTTNKASPPTADVIGSPGIIRPATTPTLNGKATIPTTGGSAMRDVYGDSSGNLDLRYSTDLDAGTIRTLSDTAAEPGALDEYTARGSPGSSIAMALIDGG